MKEQPKVSKPVTAPAVVAPAAVAVPKPTLDELKTQLKASIIDNNDALFNELVTKIAKMKSELAKQAGELAKEEAKALSGVRMQVAVAIFTAVKKLNLDAKLIEVKAKGFTYPLDLPDAQGVMVTYKSVALSVPTVKTRAGGTTGGGKSKDEYGMSLGEIFDKFATPAQKAELSSLTAHNAAYFFKLTVKKAAIAAGMLQPVK